LFLFSILFVVVLFEDSGRIKRSWFNYSDGPHFGGNVSIWYMLLKKFQLHSNL